MKNQILSVRLSVDERKRLGQYRTEKMRNKGKCGKI